MSKIDIKFKSISTTAAQNMTMFAGLTEDDQLTALLPMIGNKLIKAYKLPESKPAQAPAQEEAVPAESPKPVSIYRNPDGTPAGVRVRTLDDDFIIALENYRHDDDKDPARLDWKTMMQEIEAGSFDTLTRKQWGFVSAYIYDINAALEEAGGEKITDGWYWSKDGLDKVPYPDGEYYGKNAWCFYSPRGSSYSNFKCLTYRVRPVLAFNHPLNS